MIDFKEPALADKTRADAVFRSANIRTDDYCFGNLYIWRRRNKIQIAFCGEMLLTRFERNGRLYYLYPVGEGDKVQALRGMAADAAERGHAFRLACMTPSMRRELDSLFPGKFEFQDDRASYDYLYRAADLISLAGRKYHSKRNHVTRFKAAGDWSYEEITEKNIDECREMNEEWCRRNACDKSKSLSDEYCAVQTAFNHYFELGFLGGLLRQNGRVVAFTMGERLCSDTFDIHIEKAFSDVEGAYAAINNEFALRNLGGYVYINREEDMGIEGLRKAKLSWHPAMLLEKCYACLKEGAML